MAVAGVVTQDDVVHDGERGHHSLGVTIFGNVGNAFATSLACGVIGDVGVSEHDSALVWDQPGECANEGLLPVSGYASNTNERPLVDFQRNAIEVADTCLIRREPGCPQLQMGSGRGRENVPLHIRLPDDGVDKLVLIPGASLRTMDDTTLTKDGRPIGVVQDVLDTMGDEEDGGSAVEDPAKEREQPFGFDRRQGGCGFVEDQYTRIATQNLEDFDDLTIADREILDPVVDSKIGSNLIDQAPGVPTCTGTIEKAPPTGLDAERDVLPDGERFYEGKVLGNESHTRPNRGHRRPER